MTLAEAIRKVVKEYVSEHGRDDVVTRQQLSNMVMEAFPHNPNSFLPADYCYNRTNKGICTYQIEGGNSYDLPF